MNLTLDQFQKATGASAYDAGLYYEPTLAAMERFGISELTPVAAFISTITVESNRLQQVEESLYYKDPERIARIYLRLFDLNKDRHITPDEVEAAKPYCRNHAALSRLLYAGYHGRGLIQITFKSNYEAAGDALGYDYVGDPNLVTQPEHAALTAAWFFATKGCIDASARSMDACTRIVNPAMMHADVRRACYDLNMELFA